MTMHVKDAGSWKEVTQPSVRDAGVWKDVQEGWVKDAGVWKQFYNAEQVVLTNQTPTDFQVGSTATAGIIFNTTGQLQERIGGSVDPIVGEWLDPVGDGSAYRVKATLTGFDAPTSGPTLGVWHSLATTREWRNDAISIGTEKSELLVEIDKGDGVVLASATMTITATQDTL